MKTLYLYRPIAGTRNDYINHLDENNLYDQAQTFWDGLEGISPLLLIVCVVLGIAGAAYYYGPYNNKPGRHYKPKHWLGWWAITFFAVLILTLLLEYLLAEPALPGAKPLEIKIAICNAVYAAFIYVITSLIWCMALPTNAYRMVKKRI